MMAELESKIERRTCQKALQLIGIRNIKLKAVGQTGFPDRMFLIPGGKPLLVEFKLPGESPDPKQAYIHNLLISLGYQVEVHDDVEEALRSIRKTVESALISEKGS